MLEASDLTVDHGLLTATAARGHATEAGSREAQVVAWTHVRGASASPYRAGVLRRERGIAVGELCDGRPGELRDVTLYGLDSLGRMAIERAYGEDGAITLETVARYEATHRTFATSLWDGAWRVLEVALERWDHGRPAMVATLSAADGWTLVREHYRYEDDRVVAIAEVRAAADGDELERRSWSVEYGDDGTPAALLQDGDVVWQRVVSEPRL